MNDETLGMFETTKMFHTSVMDKARAQKVHTVSTGITSQNGGGGGGFQP